MKEQKNIDRLFQEKFKDFEVFPQEFVWHQIEKKLPAKKSKRKVIPLFWKLGGVASSLVFIGCLYFLYENNTISKHEENIVVSPNQLNEKKVKENVDIPKSESPAENVLINLDSLSMVKRKSILDSKKSNQNRWVQNKDIIHKERSNNKRENSSFTNNSFQNQMVHEKEQLETVLIEKQDTINQINNRTIYTGVTNTIVEGDKNRSTSLNDHAALNQNNRTPLTDSISDSDAAVAKTVDPKNPLEELLLVKEKEQNTALDSKIDRWQIASSIAPVYFNSLAGGSTLDPQFADNVKTSETQMSYGIGIQYAVNKKISLRTGINMLNLGYNTQGVDFKAALDGQVLSNVDPNAFGQTFQIQNSSGVTAFIENPIQTLDQGFLNQRLGYLEVPFELKYRIIDQKFGFTVIGGMSSLILTDNQINAVTASFNTNLGEATNLNSFSLSTNFGVGLDYRFFKSLQAHFEPMIKYQMNTFSNNTSGFRPYFFGIYSGISYHF
jgi:hypothetical protein